MYWCAGKSVEVCVRVLEGVLDVGEVAGPTDLSLRTIVRVGVSV